MGKRKICDGCGRPQTTCLCAVLVERDCRFRLVILQDPKEAKHALSSAPLLARSLRGSRLWVGEQFDPETVLGEHWRRDCLLVFPGEAAISHQQARQQPFRQLLLLDGSWRKVARLMHLNPWLKELPCLAIKPTTPSNYRIRKSPRSDGLSTIEAAVIALNTLDQGCDYSNILPAFERMIDLQIAAMGAATYRRNYPGRNTD